MPVAVRLLDEVDIVGGENSNSIRTIDTTEVPTIQLEEGRNKKVETRGTMRSLQTFILLSTFELCILSQPPFTPYLSCDDQYLSHFEREFIFILPFKIKQCRTTSVEQLRYL